jgi:DNA-binding response OmpR family regulator
MTSGAQKDLGNMRVLVVDDDMSYRHLLANMLHNIGIGSVPMAANVDDAQTEIRDSSVDFLVVDRTLEGTGGFALTKYLRDPGKTPAPHIPIVMTTDNGQAHYIAAAIKSGADHVLAKPISTAELELTLRNLIRHPPEKIEVSGYVGPCRRRLPGDLYRPYGGEDRRHLEAQSS